MKRFLSVCGVIAAVLFFLVIVPSDIFLANSYWERGVPSVTRSDRQGGEAVIRMWGPVVGYVVLVLWVEFGVRMLLLEDRSLPRLLGSIFLISAAILSLIWQTIFSISSSYFTSTGVRFLGTVGASLQVPKYILTAAGVVLCGIVLRTNWKGYGLYSSATALLYLLAAVVTNLAVSGGSMRSGSAGHMRVVLALMLPDLVAAVVYQWIAVTSFRQYRRDVESGD